MEMIHFGGKKWLTKFLLISGSLLMFFALSATTFAASPTLSAQVYEDNNGDGVVERIKLTFNQNIETCTATVADFAYVANDLTSSAITGGTVTCTGGSADAFVYINFGTPATANITSHSTAPTIAYTDDAGRAITNAAVEEVATFGIQNLADGAAPYALALTMSDAAGSYDGKVDRVTITYTEALANTAAAANGFDITSAANHGTCDTEAADPDGTATLTVNFTCSSVYTAIGDLNVVFTENAGVKDAADNLSKTKTFTSASTPAIVDGVGPIVTALTMSDSAGTYDGKIDRITLTYSEALSNTASAANGFDITSAANHGTCDTEAADPDGTTTLVLNFACTMTYTAIGDMNAVFTANAGVKDAANNQSPTKTFTSGSSPAIVDGAAPAVTALTMADASTNDGKIDRITLTYSELLSDTASAANGFDITSAANHGTCNTEAADPDGTSTLVLTFTCSGVYTAVGDMNAVFTANAGVKDAANNQTATKTYTSASSPAIVDGAKPILVSATKGINGSNQNTVALIYSEPMYLDNSNQDGTMDAADTVGGETFTSTTTIGGLAAAAGTTATVTDSVAIENLGIFATTGTFVPTAQTNNSVAVSADGLTLTVALNSVSGTYFTNSGTAPSGSFTPTNGVYVLAQTPIATTVTQRYNTSATAPTSTGSWDTTAPSQITQYRATLIGGAGNSARMGWQTHATLSDWSRYMIAYGTSTGVSLTSTLWTSSNDPTIATITTDNTTVTGLTNGTTYYSKIYAIDDAGNVATASAEASFVIMGGASGTSDATAPAAPTNFKAVVNSTNGVDLTWEDPSDSDLFYIQIARSKGDGVEVNNILTTVVKDAEKYTDLDVVLGEVVNYKLKAYDNTGNASAPTSTVTLTVVVGNTATIESTEETPTTEEESSTTEETGEEDPITVITEDGTIITLSDVGTHWAVDQIEAMVGQEIITGNPDGSFNPDNNLNRAEAAALLYRVLGLGEPLAPEAKPFSDVEIDAWYAGYVNELKTLELVNGNPDGTYAPANDVNRAEFLTVALNTYYYLADEGTKAVIDELLAGEKTDAYSDLEDDWYTPIVTTSTELGFVNGSTCGEMKCFNAEDSITRAEATVILYNMFYTYLTIGDEAVVEEEIPVDETEVLDSPAAEVPEVL